MSIYQSLHDVVENYPFADTIGLADYYGPELTPEIIHAAEANLGVKGFWETRLSYDALAQL